jgi:adenylate cyclase
VRSFKPAERFQDELVRSFPLALLETAGGTPYGRGLPPEGPGGEAATGERAKTSVWNPISAPLRGGALLVNFTGPPGTFPAISFHRVMAGEFEPGTFRGRIALIGAWYRESHDLFPTPFFHAAGARAPASGTAGGGTAAGGGSGMYGVEVHANALDTLFSGRYIRPWTWRQNLLFMGLLALCGSLALVSLPPLRGLGAVAALAGVLVLVSFTLFSRGGRWVRLSEPLFIIGFAYTGAVFYRYFTEERENRLIRGLFSRYVSRQVVAQLLADPGRVRLGGETRDVVIFFCDIRGFTGLTERTGPEEVVGMLNDFFREMTEVIFKYDGTLNKYIGDALLAFYGAPIAHEDDAARAVLACLEMRDRLDALNRERASRGAETIAVGMGVHRGPVVVGNVGSPMRMEYTAVGDPVNTCQRVESLTRRLEAGILITEQVYREVSGLVKVRSIEPVTVKGKRDPLRLYEVLGVKGGSRP